MTLRRYAPLKPSAGTQIPAAVRRAVRERDGGFCVGPLVGMPGECSGSIELDHVLTGGMGMKSPSTVEGLASLCGFHHRMKTLEGRRWRPRLMAYLTGGDQ